MPLAIIELALRIVLVAMEGQTTEQKKIMWDQWIEFVEGIKKSADWWRKVLKLEPGQ